MDGHHPLPRPATSREVPARRAQPPVAIRALDAPVALDIVLIFFWVTLLLVVERGRAPAIVLLMSGLASGGVGVLLRRVIAVLFYTWARRR